MNVRVIAVLVIVCVVVAAGFYELGQRSGPKPVAASNDSTVHIASGNNVAATMQGTPAVSGDPAVKLNLGSGASAGSTGFHGSGGIAHFEIGNRNVKALYADGDVIWLGTSGGVIRYESKTDQYKVFDNMTPGILSNGIFHISKLGDKILVGSYGGGLSVLEPTTGQWRNYNIPNGLADQFVYDVHAASNGDVWIATWSGVNRIKQGQFDDRPSWESFTVENTQGGLPNPWVYGVEEGKNGDMWFATESGLARFSGGKWENWQHKDGLGAPLEKVRDAIQFTNDPAKSSKHHAQQKEEQGLGDVDVAFNPNYIISLVVDNDGIVWAGTWGGGLSRFDGRDWLNVTTAEGLPGNHIFMLHLDDAGQLWVGTSKGLARVDGNGGVGKVYTVNDGLYADNVFSMTRATDGSLWVGSFGGVARLAQGLVPG